MVKVNDTACAPDGRHRKRIYRTCEKCGVVGFGVNTFPPNARGMCKPCWKHRVKTKSLKPCKGCGKQFKPGNRVRYCSPACRMEHLGTNTVKLSCVVCGAAVGRYAKHVDSFSVACCSLECQRKHALEDNRGQPEPDWASRSKKAKKKWHQQHSQARRRADVWSCAISHKMKRKRALVDKDTWEYRIGLRLNAGRGRKAKRRLGDPTPSGSIVRAIARVGQRRKYFELDGWSKKVGGKLSSMTGRRRRKHESRIKSRGSDKQTEGKWIQMRFDWLGH